MADARGPYVSLYDHFKFGHFIYLNQNDSNIKGIESFEYCYLYITYGDDTKFFLKYENSIVHLSEEFTLFSDSLGLKPNTTNCKISGIGVLKGSKR